MPEEEPRRQIETADFAEEIMASLLTVKHNMNSGVIGSGVLVLIDGLPFMMTALHVIDHMIAGNQAMKEVVCHVDTYTREETCVDEFHLKEFKFLRRIYASCYTVHRC